MNKERWEKFSFEEQMGHIGSEYGRVVSLKKKGDEVNYSNSLARALNLLDMTLDDKRWHHRLYELLRLREVIADLYAKTNKYNVPKQYLNDYFLSLALLIKR